MPWKKFVMSFSSIFPAMSEKEAHSWSRSSSSWEQKIILIMQVVSEAAAW